MPALLFLLVLCLGALGTTSQQFQLAHGSAAAARLLARGEEPDRALAALRREAPDPQVSVEREGDFVCVRTGAPARFAAFRAVGLTVAARSCALAGGL